MKNGFGVEERKTPQCVVVVVEAAVDDYADDSNSSSSGGGRASAVRATAAAARETKSSVGGADVNQLHVTLDISAANGKWMECSGVGFWGFFYTPNRDGSNHEFQDPSAVDPKYSTSIYNVID